MGRHWAPMLFNMDSAKNAHTQTHVRIQAACTCTWATKEQMCGLTHTHTNSTHISRRATLTYELHIRTTGATGANVFGRIAASVERQVTSAPTRNHNVNPSS